MFDALGAPRYGFLLATGWVWGLARWGIGFLGATVMTTGIWIAYGLSIGRGQSNFWGMPITGNVLALYTGMQPAASG